MKYASPLEFDHCLNQILIISCGPIRKIIYFKLWSVTEDLVTKEDWNVQGRVAAVRTYYRHGDSLVTAVHEYLIAIILLP